MKSITVIDTATPVKVSQYVDLSSSNASDFMVVETLEGKRYRVIGGEFNITHSQLIGKFEPIEPPKSV